jgi:hypothetical protein
VSGVATVIEPWIESARYAAEWRDHWWQYVRDTEDERSIEQPPRAAPYPTKADEVAVKPKYDHGGNFGRLPRARPLMDDFIRRSMAHEVLGIPVSAWVSFLSLHKDTSTPEDIATSLQAQLKRHANRIVPSAADQILMRILEIRGLLEA